MLKFSTYMGYDITIDDNNGNGVIAKAEHPYKDILIKKIYELNSKTIAEYILGSELKNTLYQ